MSRHKEATGRGRACHALLGGLCDEELLQLRIGGDGEGNVHEGAAVLGDRLIVESSRCLHRVINQCRLCLQDPAKANPSLT